MMILWSLAVMLRGLDNCLLVSSLRSYFVILLESLKDSKAFLLIVAYNCFVFALVYSLIAIGDLEKLPLIELVFIVFQDSLGGFSAPDSEETNNFDLRMVLWTVFILLLVVTNIIGLNSLIAIIGDSYERVQTDKAFYDAIQKFGLLNELNNIYLFFYRNKKVVADYVYIHIVTYADASQAKKEWKGRIQNVRDCVQEAVVTLKEQIGEVRGDMA